MNFRDYSGPPHFEIVTKPIGPICNMDCSYCFYLDKEQLYPGEIQWAMSSKLLESYIRQMIEGQHGPVVRFVWQGGEPTLLGVDFFQAVVDIQKRHANGKQIDNALQTNGVNLSEEWCEFFRKNRFLIGLSVDGPREIHDRYRVLKGGQPTFDRVMNGLRLVQSCGVEYNTLTCVHRANQDHPLEVYRFLKNAGSQYLQFIPIVEPLLPPPYRNVKYPVKVSDRTVNARKYGRFLSRIFDEWIRKDVGKVFVQTFESALAASLGLPQSLCVFAGQCGNALALEHNGDLFSCDHFVNDGNKLGNLETSPLRSMVDSMQQREFGFDKKDSLPRSCRACDVSYFCNGECPKNRFLKTPAGEEGLNYLCEGYKFFFRHVSPHMAFLAKGMRKSHDF